MMETSLSSCSLYERRSRGLNFQSVPRYRRANARLLQTGSLPAGRMRAGTMIPVQANHGDRWSVRQHIWRRSKLCRQLHGLRCGPPLYFESVFPIYRAVCDLQLMFLPTADGVDYRSVEEPDKSAVFHNHANISICYRPSSSRGCRMPSTRPCGTSSKQTRTVYPLALTVRGITRMPPVRHEGVCLCHGVVRCPSLHSISPMCEGRHQKSCHAALRNLIVGFPRWPAVLHLVSPEISFRHHFNLGAARQSVPLSVSCKGRISCGQL